MAKKITFEEFQSLPMYEKLDVLYIIGNFLDTRDEEQTQVILYSVDLFFVEIFYNPRLTKIMDVVEFKTGEVIDKYSNQNQVISGQKISRKPNI